ncbi:hypothetical protein [Aurantimonas sp. A3-2-R12]|uniref:hypothetical protein n=1 Tax=Aurantimonas sp. A3-2-R12 TaxID=3114362 RepID=UPI002E19842E|nr:hypothetical protein [Aurantimonas sp. A3-2-R12]
MNGTAVQSARSVAIGIDVGTSGVRVGALGAESAPVGSAIRYNEPRQDAAIITGFDGAGDANNVRKTGYDASAQAWPDWIEAVGMPIAARLTLSPSAVP